MITPLKSQTRTSLTAKTAEPPVRALGIPELDDALGGGMEPGTTWLLEGLPGGGKSLLATQFIAQGIARGEGGLYISASEAPARLIRAFARSWPGLEAAIEQHQLAVLDPSPFFTELRLGMQRDKKRPQVLWNEVWHFVQDVARQGRNLNAKRIVIDPITPLLLAYESEMALWDMVQMLISALDHNLGATTVLTHAPFAQPISQTLANVLETLCFGVLATEQRRINLDGTAQLTIDIMKQRHHLPSRHQVRVTIGGDGHLVASPREVKRA